jgi:phosphoribosylglycinamide formyltransferase-1
LGKIKRQKAVVLASGRGSNFEALVRAEKAGVISPFEIIGLISNQPGSGARELARNFCIPEVLVNSQPFKSPRGFDRSHYESELLKCLTALKPDWIFLAGYMLVLGPEIIAAFPKRILNIHPSLLPKHRGLRAQKQAIDAGDRIAGCSVHYVTEELDGGPIILQKSLEILPNDTEESLSKRLLPLEHETYIEALQRIAQELN